MNKKTPDIHTSWNTGVAALYLSILTISATMTGMFVYVVFTTDSSVDQAFGLGWALIFGLLPIFLSSLIFMFLETYFKKGERFKVVRFATAIAMPAIIVAVALFISLAIIFG
ncbi:MAG: hypothetical protein WDZ79_02945 [Candidatus Paceibacterota bacterium]